MLPRPAPYQALPPLVCTHSSLPPALLSALSISLYPAVPPGPRRFSFQLPATFTWASHGPGEILLRCSWRILNQELAAMATYPPVGSGQWNSGLCDCFQDCNSFLCSWCCPCIVVGQLVEIIDEGITSCMTAGALYFLLQNFTGCGCLYTCGYRGRLRAKYGLAPAPCGDCCVDCWCLPCSLAQQYREMTSRGIQPDLGWAANRTVYENAAPLQQKMDGY